MAMFIVMLLAHLLGDYLFQFDALARWKSRSLWGVVAHGGIVTATTLACAALIDPTWWPYALLIGVTHTGIDVVRARLIHTTSTTWDMVLYLLDQVAHVAIIVLVVWQSGAAMRRPPETVLVRVDPLKMLAVVTGYLLLLHPAWVLLRFIVRGVWGAESAPHLGTGEKYGPMVERVVITTLVVVGQFYWIPLVLFPRRLMAIQWQNNGVGVMMQLTAHWGETLLSVLLAAGVGLILRATGFF